jgi:hypothetical protein
MKFVTEVTGYTKEEKIRRESIRDKLQVHAP